MLTRRTFGAERLTWGMVFCLLLPLACRTAADRPGAPPSPSQRLAVFLTAKRQFTLEQASFTDLLMALNQQTGVSFVADGEPLLKTAEINFTGTGRDLLDYLVDLFDYRWKASKSGGVVLNKRFRNPNDVPQTHPGEMVRTAHNILNAMRVVTFDIHQEEQRRRLSFGIGWQPMIFDLANSFTPDQRQLLKLGRKLTPMDMTPPQFALLEDVVCTCALSPFRGVWIDLELAYAAIPRGYIKVADYNESIGPCLLLLDKDQQTIPADLYIYSSRATHQVIEGNP